MKKIVNTRDIEILDITDFGVEFTDAELKKTIEFFTYLRDRLDQNLKKHQSDTMKDKEKSWITYGAFQFVTNCLKELKK